MLLEDEGALLKWDMLGLHKEEAHKDGHHNDTAGEEKERSPLQATGLLAVLMHCECRALFGLVQHKTENGKSIYFAIIESAVWRCDCMSTAVLTEEVTRSCRNMMTH